MIVEPFSPASTSQMTHYLFTYAPAVWLLPKRVRKYSDEDVLNDMGKPSIPFTWLFCISKPKLWHKMLSWNATGLFVVFFSFECKMLVSSSVPDLPHFVQTLLKIPPLAETCSRLAFNHNSIFNLSCIDLTQLHISVTNPFSNIFHQ